MRSILIVLVLLVGCNTDAQLRNLSAAASANCKDLCKKIIGMSPDSVSLKFDTSGTNITGFTSKCICRSIIEPFRVIYQRREVFGKFSSAKYSMIFELAPIQNQKKKE